MKIKNVTKKTLIIKIEGRRKVRFDPGDTHNILAEVAKELIKSRKFKEV